jgi:hypothetical protein
MPRHSGANGAAAKARKKIAKSTKRPQRSVNGATATRRTGLRARVVAKGANPGDSQTVRRGEGVDFALKQMKKRAQRRTRRATIDHDAAIGKGSIRRSHR